MAAVDTVWLSIVNPNSERHETLVKRRLVSLEKATETTMWKEWPADTPAVAYDAEDNVVKYLPAPEGTTFEIELAQSFISTTTPTGKWWYGNFTKTGGSNHVFTAEQEGQLDDNNSFMFLYNEYNGKILIEVGDFGNGDFVFYYENGDSTTDFTISSKRYGDSSLSSRYYVITLPEPGALAGDKVKITFNEHLK